MTTKSECCFVIQSLSHLWDICCPLTPTDFASLLATSTFMSKYILLSFIFVFLSNIRICNVYAHAIFCLVTTHFNYKQNIIFRGIGKHCWCSMKTLTILQPTWQYVCYVTQQWIRFFSINTREFAVKFWLILYFVQMNVLPRSTIEELMEANKHLQLPRLSSQELLDELCPAFSSVRSKK